MILKTILTIIIIVTIILLIAPAETIKDVPLAAQAQIYVKKNVTQAFNKGMETIKTYGKDIVGDVFNIIESRVQEKVTEQIDGVESDVQDTIDNL